MFKELYPAVVASLENISEWIPVSCSPCRSYKQFSESRSLCVDVLHNFRSSDVFDRLCPGRGGRWQTNPNAANNKQANTSSQPSCRLCFGVLQACFVQSIPGHLHCTAAGAHCIYQCQGPTSQRTHTGLLSGV